MTAAQPLYVRDGSRFVPLDEARPARPVPPIPTPVPVDIDGPEARYYRVPAPKCEHGHFARWAARNCCARGRS